ncbi:hypothetical protein DL764_010783 [Monosporascus ibericus]|uniref:DNA repair protein Rad26 n=1 Tax=Monosporascus ibericus TaxID=155417 RepID=A0A4Q4STI1_9PEZI|nr:hypothetical protein DL764_010783 [Monosporascus ibericus]
MDDFSDDDLDALNSNALQELENNAIQSTQAQKKYDDQSQTQAFFEYDFEDDDLDDTIVEDGLRGKSILPPEKPAAQPPQASIAANTVAAAAAAAPTTATRVVPQQQESWGRPPPVPGTRAGTGPGPGPGPAANHFRPQPAVAVSRQQQPQPNRSQLGRQPLGVRSSQQQKQQQQPPSHTQLQPPPFSQIRPRPPPPLPRPAPPVPSRYQASQQPSRSTGPTSHELAALQAQILDLQARLNTKDGEIQIVRSRLEKSRQDHERELQMLKKQTAEQIAKQERAVEAAKAAERTASTELEFTRRDLREELGRARRRDAPGTPKKNAAAKSWGVSDGFEDVEMAGSPSKGQRGRNAGAVAIAIAEPPARVAKTPTKGKRKRQAVDSPVNALETHSEDAMVLDDPEPNNSIAGIQTAVLSRRPLFDYLKIILNHSAAHGRSLVFDYLAGFALPSRPTESLASILFQKLAAIGNPNDPMRLPIEFCEQVIQLWEACRKESCLEPITELVSLIAITLQLHTTTVAPYIAPSLISIAMESCYDVCIPRFHNPNPGDPTDESWIKLNRNIPTTQILSLLYLTALGCAASPPIGGGLTSPLSDFWSEIHAQFVLMLLNPKLPVEDFLATLRLLCTSVFPQSIGPTPPGQTAEFTAAHILEWVSLQLVETPRWDIDRAALWAVRNEIIKTLAAFARSEFGLVQLASSDCLVPRLVTLICASVDELYDGDMQFIPLPKATTASTSTSASRNRSKATAPPSPSTGDPLFSSSSPMRLDEGLSSLISNAMLLLHTIVRSPATRHLVDVPAKLGRVMGGPQKYLLTLARLNFADTDVDDGGMVNEETAELAHELLELAVTEEEGAELGIYFGG